MDEGASRTGSRDPRGARRRVRVEHLMGTVIGVDVRDALPENVIDGALDAFFAELVDVEARFSPYLPDSEVSRIGRGELALDDASADVRWIAGAADDLKRSSGGAFDAWSGSAERPFDPSGIVKGWSVDEAAYRHLAGAGLRDYMVNAGGDILTAGEARPGEAWRVGIRHPDRPDAIGAVLMVSDLAIATSGLYERGAHIVDPRASAPTTTDLDPDRGGEADRIVSMTVVGPSLTWADAYATAAFLMGLDGLRWVHERIGYGALAITSEGRVTWTDAMDARLVDRGASASSKAALVDVPRR